MKLTNYMRDAYVRSVMNDVPSIDYSEKIQKLLTEDAVSQLPEKVRALWKSEATRPYVGTFWHNGKRWSGIMLPGIESAFKESEATAKAIAELRAKSDAQDQTARTLKDKVHAAAYAVGTRKALADMIPEFEKYLPADEQVAIRTLPVVANVMADFVKAGWPKDKVAPKAKLKVAA